MMNCGIDIIEISRIESAIKDTPGFLERIFSQEELLYYQENGNRVEILAGFFAAKEAYSKFLGTGISGFAFKDISVQHTHLGKPLIFFKGKPTRTNVSISHNNSTAVSVVCGDSTPDISVPDQIKSLLPYRSENSNKGDFGRILVVAGSEGMTGAAVLSAYSALRTGSGLVTLATPDTQRAIAASYFPEIMTKGLPSSKGILSCAAMKELFKISKDKDALVFGPGLGQSPDIFLILQELLKNYRGTLIIDADGLNALSKDPQILHRRSCRIILTPHPGEMSRLSKQPVQYIQNNRTSVAEAFANEYNICLVLKGHKTVVAQKDSDTYTNTTGNCGMATAGTGDVLAGVIASFVGQGLSPFDASKLGVYTHGLAGDLAQHNLGTHGMIASDVIDNIPYAIKKIADNF